MDRRFIYTDAKKSPCGSTRSIQVGRDIFITGLTDDQADAVWDALKVAQDHAIKSVQRELQQALGLTETNGHG